LTLLFKGIGYESLRLDGPIHPQRLKELSITRKLNEHGYMTVTGILPEEEGAQAIQTELEGQPVVLRQLDEEGHSVCRLFHGRITRFTVHCIRSIYTFELEAVSQSGQMDMERKRRSFQHTEQTYADLVTTVVHEYTYGDAIDTIAHATPLGGLVLQYDETDWQFLKRLASRFGSVLVPEITSASPKVFFGMPEGKSYALGEDTFYRIRKTFGQIRSAGKEVEEYSTPARASSNNKPMPGYISYFIDSLHYYALGDHLTLPASAGSTELVVVQAHTVLRDGLLETAYELQHPQQIRFYSDDNEQLIGITLTGRVEEVAADFVRVKLDIDEDYHHKHPKAAVNKELGWFPVSTPYAAEQHTGWYDMPEKGEQVELHIPNSLESNAHVMGSLRQQSSGVSDPDTKIWSHPAGSQLQMDGQELRLSTSGHMTISLQPESGIEINSPGSIGIRGGSVQLNASQTLSLEAGEAIRLKGGQSSMIVDGDTDLHAPTIHEVGTVKAPVYVADLAPVPEPPLMTVEVYQAGQAAAQQAKTKAQAATAPPKAKITPPAEQKKASGLLGLLSKVTAAIPMKTTSKVLMGINNPLARVAGVMMQVNATVPARRSGGGGSQGIVTAAIQGVYCAAVQEQQARYHMYQAWGKAWTQARHVSLKDLITHPAQTAQAFIEAGADIYHAYREVPPHIRQQWLHNYEEYQLKQQQKEQEKEQAENANDYWGAITEFVNGMGVSAVDNASLGVSQLVFDTDLKSDHPVAFYSGKVAGDTLMTTVGMIETIGGIAGFGGSLVLDATGALLPVGITAGAASAGAVVHGAGMTSRSVNNLGNNLSDLQNVMFTKNDASIKSGETHIPVSPSPKEILGLPEVKRPRESLNDLVVIDERIKKSRPNEKQKHLTKEQKKIANQHINDLAARKEGDLTAANRLQRYREHLRDDGWTSLDLSENNGASNIMRLLYKEEPDGSIEWKVIQNH